MRKVKSPWPCYSTEEMEAVCSVMATNKVNYWTGDVGRKFEREFAAFAGVDYAVGLSSGTAALELALIATGIGAGDKVLVASKTYIASASAIVLVGADPVFVDVDRDSQNIRMDAIAAATTERTRAVIAVHLAGWPCEMNELLAFAKRRGLKVIEDCAQAHGAKYRGQSVGSFGHAAAWSFCHDKIMTTGGEGGMLTTNDCDIWEKAWSYKDHGKSWKAVYKRERPPGFQWLHESFGTNRRMTELQAAIGHQQIKFMPAWHEARTRNANRILDICAGFPSVVRPPRPPRYVEHAWYKCYVFVRPESLRSGWSRDRIMNEVTARGVPCFTGTCSEVYLEKAFDGSRFKPQKRLPIAKELGETSLLFLVHPSLTNEEMDLTCETIHKVFSLAVR